MKVTQVVAALIIQEGKILVFRRPAQKARGLLWEFVGGKVEPGETQEEALIRECREELGIELSVGNVFMEVDHIYPDLTIHLTLYYAKIRSGKPKLLEHCEMALLSPSELDDYEFCPADQEILTEIKRIFI